MVKKDEKLETDLFLVDLLIVACRKIQKKEQLEFVKKKSAYWAVCPNDSVFQL